MPETIGNIESILEKVLQKAQAKLKETQIAAVRATDFPPPATAHRDGTEINDPVIGEAGSDHKPGNSFRVGNVALVEVESATFGVREEGFNPKSLGIETTGLFGRAQIGHEINGLLAVFPPPAESKNRPVFLLREFASRSVKDFARGSVVAHVLEYEGLVFPIEGNIERCAACIVPFPVFDDSLKIDAVKLTIAHENDFGAFGN